MNLKGRMGPNYERFLPVRPRNLDLGWKCRVTDIFSGGGTQTETCPKETKLNTGEHRDILEQWVDLNKESIVSRKEMLKTHI